MTRVKTPAASSRQGQQRSKSLRLYQSVGAFAAFAEALALVGKLSPERMTVSQTLFFILAAVTDLQGGNATLTGIKEEMGPELNKSIHSTYGILMAPSKRFPEALGWLTAVPNPNDNREKFLHLTPKGTEVMETLSHLFTVQA